MMMINFDTMINFDIIFNTLSYVEQLEFIFNIIWVLNTILLYLILTRLYILQTDVKFMIRGIESAISSLLIFSFLLCLVDIQLPFFIAFLIFFVLDLGFKIFNIILNQKISYSLNQQLYM